MNHHPFHYTCYILIKWDRNNFPPRVIFNSALNIILKRLRILQNFFETDLVKRISFRDSISFMIELSRYCDLKGSTRERSISRN